MPKYRVELSMVVEFEAADAQVAEDGAIYYAEAQLRSRPWRDVLVVQEPEEVEGD